MATRRNDPQAISPAVKSLNYLNNVLGALELRDAGVDEGLFLTTAGYVCECTADNFFLIKGRRLMTPHPALGALAGITRGWSCDWRPRWVWRLRRVLHPLRGV